MIRKDVLTTVQTQKSTARRSCSLVSALRAFSLIIFVAAAAPYAAAQSQGPADDAAPPPPKRLTEEEKARLDALDTKVKSRTKAALDFMELRLKKAEQFNAAGDHDAMFSEMGGLHALVDNTLEYLDSKNGRRGSVQNNFKRFEIGLRKLAPRLEVIRRELPSKYEFYTRQLIIYVRDARSRAVEPLFGESVVPNNDPG